MSKAIINGETWNRRSGSYSTHGSRSGLNLLGWELLVKEVLSLEQQRDSLVAALKAAEFSRKSLDSNSEEYVQVGARMSSIANQLRALKAKGAVAKRYQNVGDHLVAMFKERVTRVEWQAIVEEAQQRHDDQECLRQLSEMLSVDIGEVSHA